MRVHIVGDGDATVFEQVHAVFRILRRYYDHRCAEYACCGHLDPDADAAAGAGVDHDGRCDHDLVHVPPELAKGVSRVNDRVIRVQEDDWLAGPSLDERSFLIPPQWPSVIVRPLLDGTRTVD